MTDEQRFARTLYAWTDDTLREALDYLVRVQMGQEKEGGNLLKISGLPVAVRARLYAEEIERREDEERARRIAGTGGTTAQQGEDES